MIPEHLRPILKKIGAEITPVEGGGEHLWVPGSDTEWEFGARPKVPVVFYEGSNSSNRPTVRTPTGVPAGAPVYDMNTGITAYRSRSDTAPMGTTGHMHSLHHLLGVLNDPHHLSLALHYLAHGQKHQQVGPWRVYGEQTIAKSSRSPFDWAVRVNAGAMHPKENVNTLRNSYIDHNPELHALARGMMVEGTAEPFLDAYIDHYKLGHLPMHDPEQMRRKLTARRYAKTKKRVLPPIKIPPGTGDSVYRPEEDTSKCVNCGHPSYGYDFCSDHCSTEFYRGKAAETRNAP